MTEKTNQSPGGAALTMSRNPQLSCPQRRANLEKPGRYRMIKVPIDTHWPTSRGRNEAQWSKEQERITVFRTYKQEELGAVLFLAHISLAYLRIFCGGALRLPVEASRTDGVILVPRRW